MPKYFPNIFHLTNPYNNYYYSSLIFSLNIIFQFFFIYNRITPYLKIEDIIMSLSKMKACKNIFHLRNIIKNEWVEKELRSQEKSHHPHGKISTHAWMHRISHQNITINTNHIRKMGYRGQHRSLHGLPRLWTILRSKIWQAT